MNRTDDTPVVENQGPALAGLRKVLPSAGQGTIGGLISTVCCLLPALAIAIGLTGGVAATLVSLGRFRPYSLLLGLAFVAATSWLSLRRSRSHCTEEEYRRRQIVVPLTMLVSFGAVYVLAMYVILPLLYRINL